MKSMNKNKNKKKICCLQNKNKIMKSMRMDMLPNEVVEYILLNLNNAKDLASVNCVSKEWKQLMSSCGKRLFFKNLQQSAPESSIVTRMVSSLANLEELVVSSPLPLAISPCIRSSLKILDLNLMNLIENDIDCIQTARNLESLRLCNVGKIRTPKWDMFPKLWNLEIHRVVFLEESSLTEVLRATPNLSRLVLDVCKCFRTETILVELPELRHCKLVFFDEYSYNLTLKAPKIEYLEVRHCILITVPESSCLKNLNIQNYQVYKVELGNLTALETLFIGGHRWDWDVISKMLQVSNGVKHLGMRISHTGGLRYCDFLPFPKFDFVDFFKARPNLKSFNIAGAMFDALCINEVVDSFMIPCLEEVVIYVEAPSNAKKMMELIDSLVKYGNKLNKIQIKFKTRMAGGVHTTADDFIEEIYRMFQDSTKELHLIRTHRHSFNLAGKNVSIVTIDNSKIKFYRL